MKFTKAQNRVLYGCLLAYTVAYLNRLNLSAALGSVMEALHITQTQAGLLQSAFAVVYASGQLINGAVVDKIRPVRHMLVGMAGLLICNLMMGFSSGYGTLMFFCMLNGAFQSMLWTPIVRLMALKFDEDQRAKANIIISLTLILGHLGAWAISGFMVSLAGWHMSFIVPALIGIPSVYFVWQLLKDAGSIGAKVTKTEQSAVHSSGHLFTMLWKTGFVAVMITCVLYGFVRDGIVTWAPKLIAGMSGGQSADSVLISLLIPALNVLGVGAAYILSVRGIKNIRYCIGIMIAAAALFCACLLPQPAAWLSAVVMGLSCAVMNGLNPLVTVMVPMQYDGAGRIGLTAGLVDSSIYIGSALAGVLGGYISQHAGQMGLYTSWLVIGLIAAAVIVISGSVRPMKALQKYNTQQK